MPIPLEQPMSEKDWMITNWADKSYRDYKAASCDQQYGCAIMHPDKCIRCDIYAFSPASEKHNAAVSYRFRAFARSNEHFEDAYYIPEHGNYNGLVHQRGLCLSCRPIDLRKVARKEIYRDQYWRRLDKLLQNMILDFATGRITEKARKAKMKRVK